MHSTPTFLYLSDFKPEGNEFIAHVSPGIKSKAELLQSLYLVLNLPDYYGGNWDALEECIRDFSWINNKKIIIAHSDLPIMDDGLLKIYLQILMDCIKYWHDQNAHELIVIFPEESRLEINRILLR